MQSDVRFADKNNHDRSMLPIELGLTMAFIFAIFLATYHVVTLLLASMLLNTLHLPVSHFGRASIFSSKHRDKLDHIYDQACRDDLKAVYWLWFGHHHVPLDLFFLFTALLGILLSVSARRLAVFPAETQPFDPFAS